MFSMSFVSSHEMGLRSHKRGAKNILNLKRDVQYQNIINRTLPAAPSASRLIEGGKDKARMEKEPS